MTAGWRGFLLMLACATLVPAAGAVILSLPPFGAAISPYGRAVDALLPTLRHVSNMVAAVNFDVRAIDTLGEESMLLCGVTGAVVLLRSRRGEGMTDRPGRLPGRVVAQRSDATALLCRLAAALILLFGVYVALHGTITPGGGFQGGVIVASSLTLLYLGEGYAVWRAFVRGDALSLLEGAGAFVFVLAGLIPLAAGGAALQNLLPLGTFRDLFSGGLMVVVNVAVACAVAGGFGLMLLEFMEETRALEAESKPGEEEAQ
jgi:multicomponent Na+:H+ antiporter subunit B